MTVPPDDCEMKAADYAYLQTLPGNDVCIDCDSTQPDWGSPQLGILFCVNCSGLHRGLGTHISFVRSVSMDRWTDQQIALMKAGGNQNCKDYLTSHGIINGWTRMSVKEKFDTPAAELYKQVLKARAEGRPEPCQLQPTTTTNSKKQVPRKMEGFGSTPAKSSAISNQTVLLIAPVLIGTAVYLFMRR
jgi:ADP-ribosylation factor GTPase-activating protein 1